MPSGIGNTGSAGNVDTKKKSDDEGGVDLGGVAGGSDPSDAPGGDDSDDGGGSPGGSSPPTSDVGGPSDDSDDSGGSPGGSSPPTSDVGGSSDGGTDPAPEPDSSNTETTTGSTGGTGGGANEATGSTSPTSGGSTSGSSDSDPKGMDGSNTDADAPEQTETQMGEEIEGPGGAAPPAQGVETETPDGQGTTPDERAATQQAQELEQQVVDRYPQLDESDVRVTRDGDQLAAELTRTGQEELSGLDAPEGGDVRLAVESRQPTEGGDVRLATESQAPAENARGSNQTPNVEGGDARLAIENRQQRREAETSEQFGDVEITNPVTGNRVEEDLENAADAFEDRASGVLLRTGAIGTPGTARLAGTREQSEVTEGLQGQVAESTVRFANLPQLAAGGKEVAEFAATQPQRAATEPREFSSDVQQRSTAIATATATRAQENPAEFAVGATVGVIGGVAAGSAVGTATRRATGGRVDLGSDVTGRTAQRVSEATRRLSSGSRSATGRAANAISDRSPNVRVERDPDAGLVEFEGDAPSLPSRPSASAVTDRVSGLRDRVSTDTDLSDSARAQAAVAASSARRAGSNAVAAVRNAPARAQVAASRARRRVSDVPADVRFELSQASGRAREFGSSVADRARPSFDRDLSLSRPLSDTNLRDSARVQAAVAASSARRRLTDAVPSRPGFDGPDTNLRQSAVAQADIVAGELRRRASEATEPVRNAPGRARVAADRTQRRLSEARADAALEAAVARGRVSERLSGLRDRDGGALPSLDTPSLSGARDITIRIGDRDGPRRGRVPENTGDDLGPFADDDLGELGALDETGASGGSDLVDRPDVDGSPGSSGGPSAVTVQRRGDVDTRRPPGDRRGDRGDRPADLERGVGTGVAAEQVFGQDAGPSVTPGVEPTDAVDGALDQGAGVGPTVETPTDVAPTQTPETGLGTGLGQPTGLGASTATSTGLRQDTRVDTRVDTRTDVRADLDGSPNRQQAITDIDAPGGNDDSAGLLDTGGDERRIRSDTLDLL